MSVVLLGDVVSVRLKREREIASLRQAMRVRFVFRRVATTFASVKKNKKFHADKEGFSKCHY